MTDNNSTLSNVNPALSALTIGNASRVQFGQPAQVQGEVIDSRFENGRDSTDPSFRRVTAADIVQRNSGSPILDSATSESGRPLTRAEIKPNSLIRVNGMQMQVSIAEQLGLVYRAPDGTYYDAANAPRSPLMQQTHPIHQTQWIPQQDQQTFDPLNNDDTSQPMPLFDAEADAMFNEAAAALPPQVVEKLAFSLAFKGELSQANLSEVASMLGMEPQKAYQTINTVYGAMIDQAEAHFRVAGVEDPQAFVDWAYDRHADLFRRAMHEHALTRSPRAYNKLLRAYLNSGRR